MGQSLVFLILITEKVTIPVGFAFHMPDTVLSAWYKNDKKLREKGIPAKERPTKPFRDPNYPTIPQMAVSLLEQFKKMHPEIRVQSVFADALYGTKEFMDRSSKIFGGIQVISQIRSNQIVRFRGKNWTVEDYFTAFPGTEQCITVRGDKQMIVNIGSARLHLQAHSKKRFIIALKYEGEDEYRYIIAFDLSWRTIDIVEAYTFRWLVEVFFQDWKGNEGWGKMTKQTGEEGSVRSLILSLLVDHCILLHPAQLAQIESKLSAYTVGSLMSKIKVEALLDTFENIIFSEEPIEQFKTFAKMLEHNVVSLSPSKKHMINRQIGNFEATKSLKYKRVA